MAARKKATSAHLSILEAVETLEGFADLAFEREIDAASEDEITAQNQLVISKAIEKIGKENPDETIKLIKETYHVVLDYLRNFYSKDVRRVQKPEILEGVKNIMVLAGDCAQKLDKYTTLFHHTKSKSVRGLKEYKQLQEFYLTRIARRVDEGVLGKWILELTKGALTRPKKPLKLKGRVVDETKRVFIDMDSVKKDNEYELFFLRKADGTHFYNPKLIRNIKLVCDFGETIHSEVTGNAFLRLKMWQDHAMHTASKNILKAQGVYLDRFIKQAKRSHQRELVRSLYSAIMALYLSANPKNLLRNSPVKSCFEYFIDFQRFLHKALSTREYQRLIAYPVKRSERLAHVQLDLIHRLTLSLFTSVHGYQELIPVFERLFRQAAEIQSPEHLQAAEVSQCLWNRLASDYAAMKKLIKQHANGPLVKVLDVLEMGYFHYFDPIIQHNIPNQVFSLYLDEHKMTNLRLPSPTHQEFIDRAEVIPEFLGFLRTYGRKGFRRKHLLFNIQDRTSWRDHARCNALEELSTHRVYANTLEVITIPKSTDFYYQKAPYNLDNHAKVFMENFKSHLSDENCGYYFSNDMKKKLFRSFVNRILKGIHKVFFSSRNVLTIKNRLDFIEIFYLFLQLKVLDMIQPDSFSFTCKDGIDIGGASSAGLYAFLITLNCEKFTEEDVENLNMILYAPAILFRERIILPDRFERMNLAIKQIESIKEELGYQEFSKLIKKIFGPLYKTSILKTVGVMPH